MSARKAEELGNKTHGQWLQDNLAVVLVLGIAATLAALWWLQDAEAERNAVIAAALFLLLGFLLALLVKNAVAVQADLLVTLVIFLPLLVYLILSGKIEAFAAGGLNVTLVAPVKEIVISNSQVAPDSSPAHGKCSAQSYSNRPLQPVYLTLTLRACRATPDEGAGDYALEDVRRWVDEDATGGDFKYLIVLNEIGEFHAAIDARSAATLLASDQGASFIEAINDGSLNRENGAQYRVLTFDALSDNATNIAALQEMEERNLDALVVVYGDNRIKGVLSREQVLSSMMLALAKSSE